MRLGKRHPSPTVTKAFVSSDGGFERASPMLARSCPFACNDLRTAVPYTVQPIRENLRIAGFHATAQRGPSVRLKGWMRLGCFTRRKERQAAFARSNAATWEKRVRIAFEHLKTSAGPGVGEIALSFSPREPQGDDQREASVKVVSPEASGLLRVVFFVGFLTEIGGIR